MLQICEKVADIHRVVQQGRRDLRQQISHRLQPLQGNPEAVALSNEGNNLITVLTSIEYSLI